MAERFGGSRRVVDRESDYSKRSSTARSHRRGTRARPRTPSACARRSWIASGTTPQWICAEAARGGGEGGGRGATCGEGREGVRGARAGDGRAPQQKSDRDVLSPGISPPETKKDRGVTECVDDDAGKRAKTEGPGRIRLPSAPRRRKLQGGATGGRQGHPRTSPRAASPAAARAVAGTRRRGTCPWTRRPCVLTRRRRRR